MSFCSYGTTADGDDLVAGLEASRGEHAIVHKIVNDETLIAAGVEPDAVVGRSAGLNVLSSLLSRLAGGFTSLRQGTLSSSSFRPGFTALLTPFPADLTRGFARHRRRRWPVRLEPPRRSAVFGKHLPIGRSGREYCDQTPIRSPRMPLRTVMMDSP